MAEVSFNYYSTELLECARCLPAAVILCVPESFSVDVGTFIEGTLTGFSQYGSTYKYTITYDDEDVTSGNVLTTDIVQGIFCLNCFTDWVRSAAGNTTLEVNTTTVESEGEDSDLMSYEVPADTLGANKERIEFRASGTYNEAVSEKLVDVSFGNILLLSISKESETSGTWEIRGTIYRVSSTSFKAIVMGNIGHPDGILSVFPFINITSGSTPWDQAHILEFTATATTDGDITQETLDVNNYAAP